MAWTRWEQSCPSRRTALECRATSMTDDRSSFVSVLLTGCFGRTGAGFGDLARPSIAGACADARESIATQTIAALADLSAPCIPYFDAISRPVGGYLCESTFWQSGAQTGQYYRNSGELRDINSRPGQGFAEWKTPSSSQVRETRMGSPAGGSGFQAVAECVDIQFFAGTLLGRISR